MITVLVRAHNLIIIEVDYLLPLLQVITKDEEGEIKSVGSPEKWLRLKGYEPSKNLSQIFSDFLKYVRDAIHGMVEDEDEDDDEDD